MSSLIHWISFMIYISYETETIEGEPGPNLYWRGDPVDYLRLFNDLHDLGKKAGVSLSLGELDYVKLRRFDELIVISEEEDRALCLKQDGSITMALSARTWQTMLCNVFAGLSFEPGHHFADPEFLHIRVENIREDANLILSSELSEPYMQTALA